MKRRGRQIYFQDSSLDEEFTNQILRFDDNIDLFFRYCIYFNSVLKLSRSFVVRYI